MSLLINSGTTTTCNYTCWDGNAPKSIEIPLFFCNFGSNFHNFIPFSTTGPRDEQFLIMK